MIAYNHESLIAQAIEGVLSQEADFEFLLVIGEDCSTDGTREICDSYASRHPKKVAVLASERNLGIQGNFFRTLAACLHADYIAFCEGDDKWTDPLKLTHQVAFLEGHPDVLAHAHNVTRRDLRNGTDRPFGSMDDGILDKRIVFTTWPYHLVSLMVRSELARKIPIPDLPYFISADTFLNRWLVCFGDIYYEGTRNLAVYHRHDQGASALSNEVETRRQEVQMLDFLRPYLGSSELYHSRIVSVFQELSLAAASGSSRTRQLWPLGERLRHILRYVGLTRLRRGSDYYYFGVMLFGRFFHVPYHRAKALFSRRR
jgi:glycosyltransferase involved in cell wall biosynthesis